MILSWNDFIQKKSIFPLPVSVTIGVFDGVHLGHRKLIHNIFKNSLTHSVVITFSINPRVVFKDSSFPGNISTLHEKIQILQDLGVDHVIVIDFSPDFSRLSGEDFLLLLVQNCKLKHLTLGENFRFGYRGKTGAEKAKEILKGKSVKVDICSMAYYKKKIVSSTRIRKEILDGHIREANKMLNRVFSLDIANIPLVFREKAIIIDKSSIHQVLPPQGHYDVSLTDTHGKKILSGCSVTSSHLYVSTGETGIRDYTAINFNTDAL